MRRYKQRRCGQSLLVDFHELLQPRQAWERNVALTLAPQIEARLAGVINIR